MFNQTDIDSIFNLAAQTVKVNDIEQEAIITNPVINEFEERYIHTLFKVGQGDLVTYQNEHYLIIAESVTKRHGKFKTLMRHCNEVIELPGEEERVLARDENGDVIVDEYGRPYYEYIQGEPILIPIIVDNKNFSIEGNQLRVPENQIIVVVQDNETNKGKFAVNNEISLMNKNWKVLHQDFTKVGLIILTYESVI